MSCKLSLISQAGGNRLWAGTVQHWAGGVTSVTVPEPFLGTQQPLTAQGTGQDKAKPPEIQGLCCAGGAGWGDPLGTAQDRDPPG